MYVVFTQRWARACSAFLDHTCDDTLRQYPSHQWKTSVELHVQCAMILIVYIERANDGVEKEPGEGDYELRDEDNILCACELKRFLSV